MEKIDLIDNSGNLTGETRDRKSVHKYGLLHHASGVIVVSESSGGGYKILSQQRSFKKEKNAGLWDMSASGHVESGETPISSLLREIEEEIGLEIEAERLNLLGKFWRNEIYREDFIENELDYIYIAYLDVDVSKISLQKEEVESIAWIPLDKFKEMIKSGKVVRREEVWKELFNTLERHKSEY